MNKFTCASLAQLWYTHTGVFTCTFQVRVEIHRILQGSEEPPTPPTLARR